MSIDMETETLLTLQAARCAFPGGKRLSLATLHRWRIHGVRGVQLETVLIGGMRYTSSEAIKRFVISQNAPALPASAGMSATQRRQQSEAAKSELQKIGI